MAHALVEIDGSCGGGQVLRTAASLAATLGPDLRVTRIHANRPSPGLTTRNLTTLRAVSTVTGGDLLGAAVGSERIELTACAAEPGEYGFEISDGGSAALLIQTLLPALLTAPGDSTLTVLGATHTPTAPCYEYLARVFLPLVSAVGVDAMVTMERAGFSPGADN